MSFSLELSNLLGKSRGGEKERDKKAVREHVCALDVLSDRDYSPQHLSLYTLVFGEYLAIGCSTSGKCLGR